MKRARIAVFGVIGSIALVPMPVSAKAPRAAATPAPAPAQSYSIDQSRYFATPETESAELKQRMDEAAAFPAVPPLDDHLYRQLSGLWTGSACHMPACVRVDSNSI